jgi:hypothetical protein
VRIQIKEAEAEANELKQTEDEQIRQALEESLKEETEQKVTEKTVGGAPPPTTAEGLRAARLGRFSK